MLSRALFFFLVHMRYNSLQFDPTTQRPYFVNTFTAQSQYDYPVAAAQLATPPLIPPPGSRPPSRPSAAAAPPSSSLSSSTSGLFSFSDDRETHLFNRSEEMVEEYPSDLPFEDVFRNLNSEQSKSPTISDSEIELEDSLLEGHDATGPMPAHSLDSFDDPSSGHGAHVVTLKGTTYSAFFELEEIVF